MNIIPTIQAGAPAGFAAAVQAACSFYDVLFTNNVTLNITFNYGSVPSNASATNVANGDYTSYNVVRSELLANAKTTNALTAWNTLPTTNPTNGGQFWVSEAQLKAWGLPYVAPPSGTTPLSGLTNTTEDGAVTLGNTYNWDFSSTTRAAAGQLDAIGTLEHEISEVMGRVGIDGTTSVGYNNNGNTYTATDLFRYTTVNGVVQRTLAPGPGSFSINGQTLLQTYNDPTKIVNGTAQGGDLADWANINQGGPTGDSYGQPSYNVPSLVSQVDMEEMNVIGWQLANNVTVATAQTLYADDPISNWALSIVDSAANVSQGLNALETLVIEGAISSIKLTDSSPTVSLIGAQLVADGQVFPLITGPYALSVSLSGNPITFTLPNSVDHITLTGSGDATLNAGGTASFTIDNKAGTVTLDYSSVTGYLTVDVPDGMVQKPGAPGTLGSTDYFTNVQVFDGGSGTNLFQSTGTGDYTFNGKGVHNTLDYSADTNGVTINLATDTVTKDLEILGGGRFGPIKITDWQDSFNDIQTFVGGASGSTTFQSIGTGDYTFTGQGTNNTLDYSNDTNGVTINLGSHTVAKNFEFLGGDPAKGIPIKATYWQDSFTDIQNFVGNASAQDTVVFDGASTQYKIVDNTDGSVTITDTVAGRDGTVHVDLIGLLQFTNTTIAA